MQWNQCPPGVAHRGTVRAGPAMNGDAERSERRTQTGSFRFIFVAHARVPAAGEVNAHKA
jgi:hypothetical protein